MFSGCNSLKYLNLYSFQIDSSVNYENIFEGLSPNVIFCIVDESTKNLILSSDQISFCSDSCLETFNIKR